MVSLVPDGSGGSDGEGDGGPRHLGVGWKYLPLRRATEDEGRRPASPMPSASMSAEERTARRVIWDGTSLDWAGLSGVVNKQGLDVGILPAVSGLVLLDCDVKHYYRESGFVFREDGSVTVADLVDTRYGVDDLMKLLPEIGLAATDIATYTVKTKSGGHHFYLGENPRVKLRTTGHREDWRVDVISHNDGADRSWAAAPPSLGYEVVRDLPVREMPDQLAVWLRDELPRRPRPGGEKRRALEKQALDARDVMLAAPYGAGAVDAELDGSLPAWRRYVTLILALVRVADQHGGWNNQVYATAKDLLQLGYGVDTVTRWISEVTPPWTDGDRAVIARTVRSAMAAIRRESGK